VSNPAVKWTHNGAPIQGASGLTHMITIGDDEAGYGTYEVEATAPNSTVKKPAKIKLSKKAAAADTGGGTNEIEVGEYDPKFAAAAGGVIGALAIIGIVAFVSQASIKLPNIEQTIDDVAAYSSRLRGLAVVASLGTGVVLLAIGSWLASLEVRGRLRAQRTVTLPAAAGSRGTMEDAAKLLEAASKLRGTIAVLASGAALFLGALWAVGTADDPPSSAPAAGSETPAADASP
jgi:hypothetical protein